MTKLTEKGMYHNKFVIVQTFFSLGYVMPIFYCISEEKWNFYLKVTLDWVIL